MFKINKKSICFLAVAALFTAMILSPVRKAYAFSTVARNTDPEKMNVIKDYHRYNSNWKYWLQGASRYPEMANWGCHFVAYAKLLKESGCPLSDRFTPDNLLVWARESRLNGTPYVTGTNRISETNVGGKGTLPCNYAKALVKTLADKGEYSDYTLELRGIEIIGMLSEQQKDNRIMDYINSGYYVIIGCSDHFTYIVRDDSLIKQRAVVSDSWSKYSQNELTLVDYNRYSRVWSTYPKYDILLYYKASTNELKPTPTPVPMSSGTVKLGTSSGNTMTTVKLNPGETIDLGFFGAKGYSEASDGGTVTWRSSNNTVATVNSGGVITANKAGTCKVSLSVTVASTNTIYTGSVTVNVGYTATPTPTPVEPVALIIGFSDGSTELTMEQGDTWDMDDFEVDKVISPTDPITVTWKSADENTVSVGADNVITALAPGYCYIKCQAKNEKTGEEYEGKIWVNILELTSERKLAKMDDVNDMVEFLMDNAEPTTTTVLPDYTYDSKMEFLMNGMTDVQNIMETAEQTDMSEVVVAIPSTWDLSMLEELLQSEQMEGLSEDAKAFIASGGLKVRKDDDYYYIFAELE